eukprot:scaffold127953_cov60-Phaeocystis_antarctica.AAC.3
MRPDARALPASSNEDLARRAAARVFRGEGEERGVALVGEALRVHADQVGIVRLECARRRELVERCLAHKLRAADPRAAHVELALPDRQVHVSSCARRAQPVAAPGPAGRLAKPRRLEPRQVVEADGALVHALGQPAPRNPLQRLCGTHARPLPHRRLVREPLAVARLHVALLLHEQREGSDGERVCQSTSDHGISLSADRWVLGSNGDHSQPWPLLRRESTESCTPRSTWSRRSPPTPTYTPRFRSDGPIWFHEQTCRPCIPADRALGRSSVAVHVQGPFDRCKGSAAVVDVCGGHLQTGPPPFTHKCRLSWLLFTTSTFLPAAVALRLNQPPMRPG